MHTGNGVSLAVEAAVRVPTIAIGSYLASETVDDCTHRMSEYSPATAAPKPTLHNPVDASKN